MSVAIRGRTRRAAEGTRNRREPPCRRGARLGDHERLGRARVRRRRVAGPRRRGRDGRHGSRQPLLARAQLALKKQLLNTQREVDEKIRKRREFLDREKTRREDVGVELYSAQQTLSRLQTQLERAEEEKRQLAGRRSAIESDLERLREWQETRVTEADARRAEADARQAELDRLNATLKRLEAQAAARGNLRRTKRLRRGEGNEALEKAKLDQDVLIDGLQETLKKLHEKTALYDAQKPRRRRRRLWLVRRYPKRNAEMDAVMAEKNNSPGSGNQPSWGTPNATRP